MNYRQLDITILCDDTRLLHPWISLLNFSWFHDWSSGAQSHCRYGIELRPGRADTSGQVAWSLPRAVDRYRARQTLVSTKPKMFDHACSGIHGAASATSSDVGARLIRLRSLWDENLDCVCASGRRGTGNKKILHDGKWWRASLSDIYTPPTIFQRQVNKFPKNGSERQNKVS